MHRSTEESSIVSSTSAEDRQLIAGDTIAAISTPAGEGAIALVRISGADSIAVADKICRAKATPSEFASHVQHFGEILDENERLAARLDSIRNEISILLATAGQGRILREGVRVVIYGATNAGKSSLLNGLLGYERVIVSETHGTTRDTIEEMINLRGVPIRLLDTAGLRTSKSNVEREGIARTEKSLQTADLRLHIADRNAPRPSHFDKRSDNGSEIV